MLYFLVALLASCVAMCIWVGWCFNQDRFPYVWPIQLLRYVLAVFIVIPYIWVLDVFLVALDCNYFSPGAAQLHMTAFPGNGELPLGTATLLAHFLTACYGGLKPVLHCCYSR